MNIAQVIVSKNKNVVKYILALFFATALISETSHRYYYRANLEFSFSWTEIELFVLVILILINMRGIRIVVLSVLMLLIFLSTKSMFFEHLSHVPRTLLLRDIFRVLKLDSSVVYIVHIALYTMFIYFMVKHKSVLEQDIIDQE